MTANDNRPGDNRVLQSLAADQHEHSGFLKARVHAAMSGLHAPAASSAEANCPTVLDNAG